MPAQTAGPKSAGTARRKTKFRLLVLYLQGVAPGPRCISTNYPITSNVRRGRHGWREPCRRSKIARSRSFTLLYKTDRTYMQGKMCRIIDFGRDGVVLLRGEEPRGRERTKLISAIGLPSISPRATKTDQRLLPIGAEPLHGSERG